MDPRGEKAFPVQIMCSTLKVDLNELIDMGTQINI